LLTAVFAATLGIVVVIIRVLESEEKKRRRSEVKREREVRVLTERISAYARNVHQQFPTGDVVVSERDLAEQLRKQTDMVVTALNLLPNEQRVQRVRCCSDQLRSDKSRNVNRSNPAESIGRCPRK
jgi:hypothetical protein